MTIERLSDTQIRATLTKQDLQERQIQISELLYGSDKAKELFHDLMQRASYECGFDAEDLPLMIEAIPVDSDCLVLVVTKVEDADELDSRFSHFTPFEEKDAPAQKPILPALADEVLNYFSQFKEMLSKKANDLGLKIEISSETAPELPASLIKVYLFEKLRDVSRFASVIQSVYHGEIELYKDNATGNYYLLLDIAGHTAEEFNKLCNIASEYGHPVTSNAATHLYYKEHFSPITGEHLLASLAKLNVNV